jgi:beta-lactam-binding protein with PASTA domain
LAGRDVPPANPGAEFNTALVLVQLPQPGYPVAAERGAQLVVSAALEVEATIQMPSLAGLTLVEARRVLDQLGLVLGNVQTRNNRPG